MTTHNELWSQLLRHLLELAKHQLAKHQCLVVCTKQKHFGQLLMCTGMLTYIVKLISTMNVNGYSVYGREHTTVCIIAKLFK